MQNPRREHIQKILQDLLGWQEYVARVRARAAPASVPVPVRARVLLHVQVRVVFYACAAPRARARARAVRHARARSHSGCRHPISSGYFSWNKLNTHFTMNGFPIAICLIQTELNSNWAKILAQLRLKSNF